MYAGLPLTGALGFAASTSDFYTMMPSDLEAPVVGAYDGTPPAGRPNFYVQESLTAFNFRVRTFTAGANCGVGGTLSAATLVSQTSYTTPSGNIVPQPGTTNHLDSLGDRVMQKVQYRKVGSTESLWVVHTTRGGASATTRPQWAQIMSQAGQLPLRPLSSKSMHPIRQFIAGWVASRQTSKVTSQSATPPRMRQIQIFRASNIRVVSQAIQ